jgi:2-polyprenyl-3-methyl-5-hydroxy-6-metoxy-1,4-benzoquinol methylase
VHTAIVRTIARYAPARSADRYYVHVKLRTDPLAAELVRVSCQLGDVVDVGCGRGQFGLLLCELGRLRSLRGYDWDPHKIASAQTAAAGVAEYEVADLRASPSYAADTYLLFDVLQYLTLSEQRQLLLDLVGTLRPGGRLLIRSTDRSRGWQSELSRWVERVGRILRVNRSHTLEFRASNELRLNLEALGLKVTSCDGGNSSLLDNRLFIAQQWEARGIPEAGSGSCESAEAVG